MKFKLICSRFSMSLVVLTLFAAYVQADVIVNDSFADGDLTKTGALDTNWWTSSSSAALDQGTMVAGTLDFITGTSGRGIHTIFTAQTLGVGYNITASYTFTTPTTIDSSGSNNSAFRVGLFDSLGQAGLDANVPASSGAPNALYGWGTPTGGPGSQPLPGYMFDMDVYNNTDGGNAAADLNIREHTQGDTGTGRLMSTTTNFASVGSSGPDLGYVWDPDTEYTGSLSVTRINATEFEITATLGGDSHTRIDTFDSDTFDMLGFHANSNKFGSSNAAGDADNGLDFSNITIVTTAPEPSSTILLGGMVAIGILRRRRK